MNCPISCVIISYNTAPYIEECLNSVFSQDLKDFEVVIVDNASTDGTTDIIKNYIKNKENVTFIENTENLGGSAAGNAGIKASKGQYVFIMDSDDIVPQSTFKTLYECAVKNNSDVVIGRAKSLIGEKIRNLKFRFYCVPYCLTGTYKNITKCKDLLISPFYWGRIYKTELLLKNEAFMPEELLFSDMYLNSKALKYAKNITVCEHLSYIWRRFKKKDEHISITSEKNQRQSFLARLESYYKFEEIFSDKKDAKILKVTRIYNLKRLLILAKFAAKNEKFAKNYYKKTREYLKQISFKYIINNKYLSIKNKVLCYLIKKKRYDEFVKYCHEDYEFETVQKGRYIVVSEDNRPSDIPLWFLRQLAPRPEACVFSGFEEKNGKYYFTFNIKTISKANIKTKRAIFVDGLGHEISISKIEKKPFGNYYISFPKVILDNLSHDKQYFINIEMLFNNFFRGPRMANEDLETLLIEKIETGFNFSSLQS